jgi:hypothetical protein
MDELTEVAELFSQLPRAVNPRWSERIGRGVVIVDLVVKTVGNTSGPGNGPSFPEYGVAMVGVDQPDPRHPVSYKTALRISLRETFGLHFADKAVIVTEGIACEGNLEGGTFDAG